jgi:hypothetical protein
VNGGKWQCVTRAASTETAADSGSTSGIGSSTTLTKFTIIMNAAGNSCTFYINGVAVVSGQATNIPTTGGQEFGYGAMALKSAGTTGTNFLDVDYQEVSVIFTTPR